MRSLIFLLLMSCAPPLTMRLDTAWTAQDRAGIDRAAEQWNARTVPSKRITLDNNGEYFVESADPGNGWNGTFSKSKRLIRIRPVPEGASVYAVALHEFGHALGLGHVTKGVMDPTRVTEDFSDEDLEECRRVRACK